MVLRPPSRPVAADRRRWAALAITMAVVVLLAAAGPARGQVLTGFEPGSLDRAPAGFELTPRAALALAERQAVVQRERRARPSLRARLFVPQYFGDRRYEVRYLAGRDVRVDVHVDGVTGRLLELWTGPQADNLLARGYDPPIGRSLNEPYVWIPLCLLFLAPFVDLRRPLRLLHLDLLVLLGFGVSQLYFREGRIDVSVPLVYPLLTYLLVRMLAAGLWPRAGGGPLLPKARARWLVAGLVLLLVFRVGLDLLDSHAIDVGQESVFGADRIVHGEPLYSRGGNTGDTYGPVTYLAYVPFDAAFPPTGPGGFEPAARAAAISFDSLVIVGLLLLGMRLRPGPPGRLLGLALAYAWAAYPFSVYALQANVNDALVGALALLAVLALSRPAVQGFVLGLASATKLAPLALAPLLLRGSGSRGPRELASFALALAGTIALAVLAYLPDGGLRELYDVTIGYQLGRESPFSLWGLHPSLSWLQTALTLGVVGLAGLLLVAPRRRDLRQTAALAAAVLIGLQLVADYWFYAYLVWFAPLVLATIFGAYRLVPERARA
jgi:hypothetical protein